MGELERRQCNSVTGSACSTSDLKRQVRLGPNKRFELENWRNKQGRDKNLEHLSQVYSVNIRLYADQTLLVFVIGGRYSSLITAGLRCLRQVFRGSLWLVDGLQQVLCVVAGLLRVFLIASGFLTKSDH